MNIQTDTITFEPSFDTLLGRARDMFPALRARAAQCEKDRKVPDETVAEMQTAGFFEVTKPREYGGYEMPYYMFCEIIMEIARGCPSSGWVYAVLGEHNQSIARKFPMEVLETIWGKDPSIRIASGNDPKLNITSTNGGYLLNGQLKFSSACHHAQWHISGGMVDGKPSTFTFARGDAKIIDTWHVMGMNGTGSNDIELKDVFVAENALVPGAQLGPKVKDAPLFRQPQWSTNPYSLASAVVGGAQGALDLYTQTIRDRKPRMGAAFNIAELQSIQMRIAESAAEIDCAKRAICGNLREVHDTLIDREDLPTDLMVRNRRDLAYVCLLAKRAIDRIFYASGAQSIYLDNDMQRFFRDVNSGAQQIFLDWDMHATTFGRAALDLDVSNTRW